MEITVVEPHEDELAAFWEDARIHAKLNNIRAYTGPNAQEALRPPAWSFGANPDQADALLGLVLTGAKTATATAMRDFEAEGEVLPTSGTMSIIVDGAGHPRALIVTTDVRVVPFGEVDAAHAHAEGEDDRTLESWREVHRAYFTETGGAEMTDDELVALERFEVLYAPEW